jgi:hypothetical protein
MLNSMNTLKSLSKLLTQIVSMVIKDEIADQVKYLSIFDHFIIFYK